MPRCRESEVETMAQYTYSWPRHSLCRTMLCMTQRNHRLGWRRAVRTLAAVGLALGAVTVAWWFRQLWEGDPYPVADPAATARQLDQRTQAVYDALDLPQAQLATDWPGGLKASGGACPYRGLRHWREQLSDSPPSEPRVVSVRGEWVLTGVSRTQAESALERVRRVMTRQGWNVTTYERSLQRLQLGLTPPGAANSIAVEAYDGDRLQVVAYAECARYPSGTPLGGAEEPLLPAQGAPAQLRR